MRAAIAECLENANSEDPADQISLTCPFECLGHYYDELGRFYKNTNDGKIVFFRQVFVSL